MSADRPPGKLKIRTAAEVETSQLTGFYERIDPRRADYRARNWRWLYRVDSRESMSPPLLAMLDGVIVGHAGLIPVTVRRGDEEHTAIWFVDFWVLPELQRQGIGIELTEAWMSLCPLQITFCNEKSLGVFLKFGWTASRETRSFRLLLRPERHPGVRNRSIRPLARLAGASVRALFRVRVSSADFPTVAPAAADQIPTDLERGHGRALHVPRTPDFLRWRILENPRSAEYLVFGLPGRESPSAIAHEVTGEGYRRLNLLAIAGDPRESRSLSNLFASILRWADREGIDDVVYVTSDPDLARVAGRWLPIRSKTLYASHANDAAGEAFLNQPGQFWESMDSDIDLAQI